MSRLADLLAAFEAGDIDKHAFIEAASRVHLSLHDTAARLDATTLARIEVRPGEVLAFTEDGLELVVDPADHRSVVLEILNWGDFEPVERSILEHALRDARTFFDIGANLGWYTLLAGRMRPGITIHCFEPIPATYARLTDHLRRNRVEAHAWNLGLSDRHGPAVFHFDPTQTGNASQRDLTGAATVTRVEVQLDTLDRFTEQQRTDPDVIKCDVEGAELLVLQGGAATLERARPFLMLEILRKWSAPYGYHPNDILDLLASLGYRCFVAPGPGVLVPFGRVDDATADTNFFFAHPDRHGALIDALVASAS